MSVIVPSERAQEDLRAIHGVRQHVRAHVHPAGGLWLAALTRTGDEIVARLAATYGTRVWRRNRWITRRVQLRLPGF